MDMFVVTGGRKLSGRVRISGAKNAALPIMAAALAAEGPVFLQDVPELVDVQTMSKLLVSLGVAVSRDADGVMKLQVVDETACVADYEMVRRMRAGVCVLGPLLAKRRKACVSLPGGCNIGDRPIDLHIKGLRALGADIRIERGYVIASAEKLHGANIYLGGPFGSTVTGTCNVMAAAAVAEGVTTIEAAACEPEVVDFGRLLNKMGARIDGLGTPFLRIDGVRRLTGTDHSVIPDRIEAATLMIAAGITGSEIELESVCLGHMTAVVEKLREIGLAIEPSDCDALGVGTAIVRPAKTLNPADIIALPYPGIPTDVQAQLMALLTRADGISLVTDKVFPDRFMHAAELVRLGSRIRREAASAVIGGVQRLSGACVMASDLRASAALVLAAMAAEGQSVVRRIYHLDRGYENMEGKLNSLGADIKRLQDTPQNVPASLQLADEFAPPVTPDWGREHTLRGPHWIKRQRAPQETPTLGEPRP